MQEKERKKKTKTKAILKSESENLKAHPQRQFPFQT
jgi:hypothetical protein